MYTCYTHSYMIVYSFPKLASPSESFSIMLITLLIGAFIYIWTKYLDQGSLSLLVLLLSLLSL